MLVFSVFLHPQAPICRALGLPTSSSLVAMRALCVPRPTGLILVTGLMSPKETIHYGSLARAHKELQHRPGLAVCSRPSCRGEQQEPRTRWLEGGASGSHWQAIRPQTMAREMSEVAGKGHGGTAGDHIRMAPGVPEAVPACSHRPLWQRGQANDPSPQCPLRLL